MMPNQKKTLRAALLCLLGMLLCGCKQNPSEDQLYEKLYSAFESAGYACTLEALPENTPVGIYQASAWRALQVSDGSANETVLVYFDESNRADYLVTMIDAEPYGYATPFGQRFILNYSGTNEALQSMLEGLGE